MVLSLLIILVVTLRDGSTLNDYANYVEIYNYSDRITEVEPSFMLIKYISKPIGGVVALFIIYSLLCTIIKLLAIKKLTDLYLLSILIYISNIMLLHDMTQIRAGVASALFLYAIPYLSKKCYLKYCLCILIATCFHYSGLLLFIPCIYWIKSLRQHKLFLYIIIPLGYILGGTIFNVSHIPIESIRFKLEMYQQLQASGAKGFQDLNLYNPYILFRICVYYILLSKRKIISVHNKYTDCLLFIDAISIAIFPLFSSISLLGYRGSELIGVVELITYPFFYYIIKPKFIAKDTVISIGILLLVVNITHKHLIII
ncbi:MAG: EpsG family protein [Muribaculaceae bacterium]|nr:EpsG family protein [Muribaculaceae bacterium]